jgi:hypothetical protein
VPLNPLLKLKRFVSAPAAVAPPPVPPATPATNPKPYQDPKVAPLTQEQLCAMSNPRSHACEHCKVKASTASLVMYTENPSFKLWLCFACWGYHQKNRVLPPLQTPRAIPKKVPSVKTTC